MAPDNKPQIPQDIARTTDKAPSNVSKSNDELVSYMLFLK